MNHDQNQSSPLLLHLYLKDMWGRHSEITDPEKQDTFYIIDYHLRSPQMVFHAGPKTEFGSVTFHLGRSIEISLHNRKIEIGIKSGWNTLKYSYSSPHLGGIELMWTSANAMAAGDIICQDANGISLAKYETGYGLKKKGAVEIAAGLHLSQEARDELIITALAVAQYRVYQGNTLLATAG